jgi:hypothetical protein
MAGRKRGDDVETLPRIQALDTDIKVMPPCINNAPYLPPGVVFARAAVPGYGSCFFCSFLYLTDPEFSKLSPKKMEQRARAFRKEFGALLDTDWYEFLAEVDPDREFPEFHDTTLKVVRSWFNRPEYWANTIIIKYVAKHMDVDIVFVDASIADLYCGILPENGEKARKTIFIFWVEREHFEPMFRVLEVKQSSGNSILTIQTEFFPGQDDDIIKHMRKYHKTKCGLSKFKV